MGRLMRLLRVKGRAEKARGASAKEVTKDGKPRLRSFEEIQEELRGRIWASVQALLATYDCRGRGLIEDEGGPALPRSPVRLRPDGYIVIGSLWDGEEPAEKKPADPIGKNAPCWAYPRRVGRPAVVQANTKSEARAALKELFGVYRLLPGVKVARVGNG